MQVLNFCTLVFTELSKDSTKLSLMVMLYVDISYYYIYVCHLRTKHVGPLMACWETKHVWIFMKICSP